MIFIEMFSCSFVYISATLAGVLDGDSLKLYTLIWSRTVACRMASAFINQVFLILKSEDC